jgi:aryl-alcohol dehydrogenase-like predicted oxidoreductase
VRSFAYRIIANGVPRRRHADDDLARDGTACGPFFPLGDFNPLQSSTLSAVAASLGTTPMQVAPAWLLRRAANILLILGTSSLVHLKENLVATEIVLSDDVCRPAAGRRRLMVSEAVCAPLVSQRRRLRRSKRGFRMIA